jgi:hypothetical protein
MPVTRETASVTLTGRTRGGLPVAGTDSVVVVDNHARSGDGDGQPVPASRPAQPSER